MQHVLARGLAALSLVAASAGACWAGCGFDLHVANTSDEAFTVTRIATATQTEKVTIYRKQWEGSRVVAAGATVRFSFTVDVCPSSRARRVKVFYTSRSGGSATYQDVEDHATGETHTLK